MCFFTSFVIEIYDIRFSVDKYLEKTPINLNGTKKNF